MEYSLFSICRYLEIIRGEFTQLQVGVEGIRGHLELMYNSLRDVASILNADEHKKAGLEHVSISSVIVRCFTRLHVEWPGH
ncbi:unnamed protein product [Toxocara canis]|uniref:Uncharacterized protein n=1 Tax=Toxocara canis TaxID=6265 RepID=A0A183U9W5_TOXCA|nr:unnamed protein product [Toxocara canis]